MSVSETVQPFLAALGSIWVAAMGNAAPPEKTPMDLLPVPSVEFLGSPSVKVVFLSEAGIRWNGQSVNLNTTESNSAQANVEKLLGGADLAFPRGL